MRQITWRASVAAVVLAACVAHAEDWPRWRGPRGDGISQEKLAAWPAEGPKKLWSARVGLGYASPIAVQGTVYVFMGEDGKEMLLALDAVTGTIKWKQSYTATGLSDGGFKGTRATPNFAEGKIYTLGGGGQVTCWDTAAEGKILWQTNVLKETGAGNLQWGTASSPLLAGDRVYVQVGKDGPVAVGLNQKTGKLEWQTEAKGLSGYAAPILIEVEGSKQLIVAGGKEIYGVAVETGQTLWREKWETSYDVNATTPLYRAGKLWISSGYGHGSMVLDVSATGAKKAWESKELASKFPGMILEGEYVYGNSEGKLKCLHWPDGKLVWKSDVKLNEGGTVVRAGDKILALSERGTLYLLQADGTAQEKLAEAKVFDAAQVWATPLLYAGKIYLKGGEDLVCYEGAK